MNEPESLLNLASVSDQEMENFLAWLFGPSLREDEMLTELQCATCGRRHWRSQGKEEEACASCGGLCSATGRFQQPDMNISDTRSRGNRSSSRAIDPQEEHRVFLPTGLFGRNALAGKAIPVVHAEKIAKQLNLEHGLHQKKGLNQGSVLDHTDINGLVVVHPDELK